MYSFRAQAPFQGFGSWTSGLYVVPGVILQFRLRTRSCSDRTILQGLLRTTCPKPSHRIPKTMYSSEPLRSNKLPERLKRKA